MSACQHFLTYDKLCSPTEHNQNLMGSNILMLYSVVYLCFLNVLCVFIIYIYREFYIDITYIKIKLKLTVVFISCFIVISVVLYIYVA